MLRSIAFFLVFIGVHSLFGQEKETCLVKYNEFDEKGQEQDIVSLAWFNEVPVIPVYTYFDKDLSKKVTIKTHISPYRNEILATCGEFKIKAGEYAVVLVECPNNKTILLLDIQKFLPDFAGQNLAFEIKVQDNKISFYYYPFENDFPFKFEDDLSVKTFSLEELNKLCGL